MAALDGLGVVTHWMYTIPGLNRRVGVWVLKLQSASDTFTVPFLDSTSGAAALTSGHTASAAASNEGVATITVTGGALDQDCVVVTYHGKGRFNYVSRDEDPT